MKRMEPIIDFYADWIEILRQMLIGYGFPVEPEVDKQLISHRYFNYKKRLIEPKPRSIIKATEFTCPPNLAMGLQFLEEKIRTGQDIKPHLSKEIVRNLNYNDGLLNDWGIFHLHLGISLDSDGFIERTGPVLFTRVDFENFYFINVLPHGSWTKQDMVKAIHSNWPDTIKQYRINGAIGLTPLVTDNDIRILRAAGVTTFVEVEPGVVYGPPGGGYMTSGISTEVVMVSDRYARKVRYFEEYIKDNINAIIEENDINGLPEELECKLTIIDNDFAALFDKYAIKLGPAVA